MIRIVIPIATPSLNQTQRMHWAKRKRLAQQLALYILATKATVTAATGKRKLTVERRGKRLLDKDNAYGGVKILVDQLKKFGLILDDDAATLDLEVVQAKVKSGEKPCTILTLEDLPVSQLSPSAAQET